MKPLKLEFSGLNSYRDAQTVDFDEIGQSGLFGIFGPTGSGKSSILDAITLALYGTVDRAAYGTQGIINMQEKFAEVSFTFELGGSRYNVRRRYDRPSHDSESARARNARLVRNDAEVLADRGDTVTAEIQRILGLTRDEFCRAVVLPQGKFDEFLTLKGAERADMLGHIFGLERFGDQLYRAADRRRGYHQGEISAAETAKAEIGDCSDGAIDNAQADAQKAKEEVKRIEDAHQEVKKELADAAELKKLNDNLAATQVRRAALDARKASIDKDQTKLDAARRAAPLKTVIDAVERLTGEQEKAAQKARRAAIDRDGAQSNLSIAQAAAKSARERQEIEEPALIERKTKLETALSEKQKLDEAVLTRDALATVLRELKGKVDEAKREVSSRELELKSLAGAIESLSKRQQDLAVDSELRERLDKAVALIAPLENAEQELGRSRRDLDVKRKASDTARSQVLRVFGDLSSIAASRYSLSDTGALVEGTAAIPLMDDAATGERFLAAADRDIDIAGTLAAQASEMEKQALIREQAAVLAAELEDGKPCPVCGSLNHPGIVAGRTAFSDTARESHRFLESCLSSLHSWKTKLQAGVTAWDNAKLNECEAAEVVIGREAGVNSALGLFREAAKQVLGELYSEDTVRSSVNQIRQEIAGKDRERPKVERQLTTVREKETATRKLLDDANAKVAAFQSQYSAKSGELSMLDEQVRNFETTLRDMTGGVDPSQGIASVESSIKNLRELAKNAAAEEELARQKLTEVTKAATSAESSLGQIEAELKEQRLTLDKGLASAGFGSEEEAAASWLPDHSVHEIEMRISEYNSASSEINGQLRQIREQIGDRRFSEEEYLALDAKVAELSEQEKAARDAAAVANERLSDMKARRARWDEWEAKRIEAEKKRDVASRLAQLVRGRAFVKFLAEEHLRDMAADASASLGSLTGQRYALETSGESDFVIRDDFNGGQRRAVNTLSGGETFLTSLSLALALSSRVQLRGQYPLGFFFLDEGFGTLDEEKLDAVIAALERLHDTNRLVGVISHVKDLKERLPLYLEVIPAGVDGSGSKVAVRRN